jgi:hypothetical protein
MNRLRLTGAFPATARSAFGDLFVDAVQAAAGPIGPVLVVDDLVPALVAGSGGPGLGQDQPVRDQLVGMLAPPLLHDVGDVGDLRAEDERQSDRLDGLLVGRGDHAGVGDDGDVGELVGGHERADGGQHGGGLGGVALERLHHQREPGRVGQQADGDLWFQAAFLGEAGLAEPITSVGLEVERADVVKHQ